MMFKRLLTIGIILAISVVFFIGGTASANGSTRLEYQSPESSIEGENQQVTPDGVVVDFSGMTEAEILEKIKMSPEAEKAIVHEVPPCPVIIDGIKYQPEQIYLFDGQQLGFVAGDDGLLYAFTTEAGIHRFIKGKNGLSASSEKSKLPLSKDTMSHFYLDAFLAGDKLDVAYTVDYSSLSSLWNNLISSLEVSTECTYCRIYEYANFQGDYHQTSGGDTEQWLDYYGWNDRASSILHVY
jgi:hypothetical protein